MTHTEWVEIISAITMFVMVVGIFINRCRKNKEGNVKGIGVRVIQLTALGTMVPVILILSLEGILDGATIGTLLGALTGYLFSHIAEYDKSRGQADAD